MTGYYDYAPTHVLDRPLVLAGYFADQTRYLGFRLAALTGLPVNNLDRLIEHRTGKSIWDLVWSEGEARYRALETELLDRSLRERPCSIVTLGDGALIDEGNRRRVAEGAQLVVFDVDLPNFYWRLKASEVADNDFWHPLHAGPVQGFEQVRPFYQQRQPGFATADHHIELAGRDDARLFDALMELLAEP